MIAIASPPRGRGLTVMPSHKAHATMPASGNDIKNMIVRNASPIAELQKLSPSEIEGST